MPMNMPARIPHVFIHVGEEGDHVDAPGLDLENAFNREGCLGLIVLSVFTRPRRQFASVAAISTSTSFGISPLIPIAPISQGSARSVVCAVSQLIESMVRELSRTMAPTIYLDCYGV